MAIAGLVGTTIEYYDFFIYGTAAALVFSQVFFPALGDVAGTVASFATSAVAFVARPLGAIVFGHYGDRWGRKGTLVTTLLMMGLSTVAIGLLPPAGVIGVAAPIALVVLRFLQGLALGGEWAGANLLTAEYAPPGRRGLYAVFPQWGGAIGFALASATFLATDAIFDDNDDAFLSYGWRIPFIASALLVLVGLWARRTIEETPVFRAASNARRTSPFAGVIREQWREVLLCGGLTGVVFALFYIGSTYLTTYGTATLGIERRIVLALGIFAAAVVALGVLVGAKLSDQYGRRTIIIVTGGLAFIWAITLFPLLTSGSPVVFGFALAVAFGLNGLAFGPVGAFLPELFATRYRYTGAGVGFNLGGIIGGAVPPLLAPVLADSFGVMAVGAMIALLAVVSVVCALALTETSRRHSLHDQHLPPRRRALKQPVL
ncbi:MFS transporter [Paractinoplanes hotanensis]|uniref:MHS family MFS transporter n=1 Tax=Paractinoplanes hotanensis TaxID=2906497 RepID=A0ABT0YHA1_9ACTN|nr:MFS transporter [Actinoplanes hotanensis]MCM4085100.1 MHS family MFS transporter [Actinoplanes hotanensis]